jgi:hypothetical protein
MKWYITPYSHAFHNNSMRKSAIALRLVVEEFALPKLTSNDEFILSSSLPSALTSNGSFAALVKTWPQTASHLIQASCIRVAPR